MINWLNRFLEINIQLRWSRIIKDFEKGIENNYPILAVVKNS